MTDVLVNYAEELFIKNQVIDAYRKAKLAQQLDPFYGGDGGILLDRYIAAYRVHAAATKRNEYGEMDWYNVLGIDDYDASEDTIIHRFCKVAKLIDPESHFSAAAQEAYDIISRAFETLRHSEKRAAFHRRWGLKPPRPKRMRLCRTMCPKNSRPVRSKNTTSFVRRGTGTSCIC
ncbi:hypothetical protein K2173_017831 [Erythroxylum novogranatense]|uniref:J domain-containing protein n=1 Tax=Erythroxylum novogranatense TaxID=1862640 RepID=A0AAV8T1U4_9ROSI|nr:hypothetical protein K2173_017831 [Erythroxylum novogranatense]